MKKNSDNLTEEEWKLLYELEDMPEEEIDTDDIPEVLEVRNPRRSSLPRRSQDRVVISLDQDILTWWESMPDGESKPDRWVNEIVRAHIEKEKNGPRS